MKLFALALIVVSLSAAPVKVRIRNATVELPLEKYVAGVLAGESSVFQSNESLKAMAIAARTYAVRLRGRHASEGFDFCVTTHCQRVELDSVTARLAAAAADTMGELLWYEGKPAFTSYTRDCGGRTEDAGAVWPELAAPYLRAHDDPYCKRNPWTWRGDPARIAEALRRAQLRAPARMERITIGERTASGRARTLVLTGGGESVRISAGSFRFAIGREIGWNTVLSDRYEIRSAATFDGFGSGHGVGLCQDGAEQMGLAGKTYREILAFYYPGTAVGLTAKGISWQRIGGEGVSLMSTQIERDRPLLVSAERMLRTITLPMPRDLELRVYPDVETFRNATGEPGWVAAYAQGRRIHLQPSTAATTLRHELWHVAVESNASPGLPLWFREGLVEYLTSPVSGTAKPPADVELRQTQDPGRARQAYRDAARAVGTLISRYGMATVTGWLKTGLPLEVKNASASQAAKNSK